MDNELKKAVKALLHYIDEQNVCDDVAFGSCDWDTEAWRSDEFEAVLEATQKALNPAQHELQRQMRETHEILSIGGNHRRTYICHVQDWPPTSTPYGWRLLVLATFEVLPSLTPLCEYKVGDITFRGLEAVSYDASLAVDPNIGKYDLILAELYFQHCDGPPEENDQCVENL